MGSPSPRERSRTRSGWLLALLALSFALRLGSVAAVTGLDTPPPAGSDEAEYDAYAWNLVQGKGYVGHSPDVVDANGNLLDHPTAYRPPTAIFYYAAIYAIAGHHYIASSIANCLVATLTVLLVFGITHRLFDRTAAWLAATVYAFYPMALYWNLSLDSESLAAFLVCLFVWLCLPFREERGGRWAIAAGLGLGVLLLCKPGFIFLIPLLPFWALAVCRSDRRLWLRASLIPLLAGVIVLPWGIRNQVEMGRFIPFGTGGGSLLLQANNRIVVADPVYRGYAVWDTSLPEYADALRAPNDEIRRDDAAKKFAVEWLKENPDKWFYLARGKLWRLWVPWYYGSGNRLLGTLACAYYAVILAAFLAAVIPVTLRFVRAREPAIIMPALILATMAMAVVFHGQHRYRFPVDSLCTIIAAGGAVQFAARLCGRSSEGMPRLTRGAKWGIAVAILAAVGVVVACVFDEQRIQAYRLSIAESRLEAIAGAVRTYEREHGRPPASLEELVPQYLPVTEYLHCPTHSLAYHEYRLLGSRDPGEAREIISYRLEGADRSEGLRIVQVKGSELIVSYPIQP